ncbi:MAG: ABC transporter substrate-binding protein [Oscillospiraceae bacterium]|nr:ABC transporter substrate-binding protein [Oscillospiraceae bacterium]
MKKLLAIFLALTMVIGLCTACSSSESDTTDEDANSVSESVEDSNDNDENLTDESSDNATSTITKMTVGSTASQFVGHFDASGLYSNDYSRAAADLCYDALFLIDSDGEWYSNVLESCEWDGLTLVLTLKDNIYFSNGDQMMASDVLYSLERYCSSPRMTSNLAYLDLESTTISEDGLTLNLVFTEEYGAYLTMLNFYILNESFVEDEMGGDDNIDWFSADSICGSGPYAVTDVELGLSVTFEKRDDWWQQDEIGDSAATVQTIVCQAYSDNNTMLIDLENVKCPLSSRQ